MGEFYIVIPMFPSPARMVVDGHKRTKAEVAFVNFDAIFLALSLFAHGAARAGQL